MRLLGTLALSLLITVLILGFGALVTMFLMVALNGFAESKVLWVFIAWGLLILAINFVVLLVVNSRMLRMEASAAPAWGPGLILAAIFTLLPIVVAGGYLLLARSS